MKLKQLLKGIKDIEVRGSKEIEITGICSDSRIVAPGHLFIAKKGEKHDGSQYIGLAVDAGARGIVTDVYDPFLKIPQIITKTPGLIEAKLAASYFGHPSNKLFVVGITGTKGKTTTTYLVRHLLEGLGERSGLIGTIETITGKNRIDSGFTTHDAIYNQKCLHEMVLQGCKSAVLEVSSHGLDQERVDEISFDIALFTNLHPDHLDYHKTVENYAAAKRKLFSRCKGVSIFNADNRWSATTQVNGKSLYFGVEKASDVQAKEIVLSENGAEFVVNGVRFVSPLMGLFNVYNLLGAISVGLARGEKLEEISRIFATFPGVPGRLERVPNDKGIHVFVDFAHTGDALASVLETLKKIAKQRIIVVFGCGGNRDEGRRKPMAEAAEKYADLSIITSDNPRNEDPEHICQQILEGYQNRENVVVEPDRKSAISQAIGQAKKGDFVLIAGRGHEKVQIFLGKTVTFDDVAIAKEMLSS